MEFSALLELIDDEPVFDSSLLMAGQVRPDAIRLQLTRWTKSGRLYQIRRGIYALAPPYQKVKPHPFLIANRIQTASYVSGQSALAFYGLIPEAVPVTLSVTGGRPESLETPLGTFVFRHVKPDFLRGYRMTNLGGGQQALVALAEKALLDLVYLQPGGDGSAFLRGLRLQNLEKLDLDELNRQAEGFGTPKLRRAVENISLLVQEETRGFETL